MIFLHLFLSFLRIGLFAIGGAYSFLPLLEKEAVEKYHWLTKDEFLNVLGMVQVFPGAISIKYATYIGYKIAGFPGVVVTNAGNLLPPLILLIIASACYMKFRNLPQIQGSFSMIQLVIFSMLIAVACKSLNINQLMSVKNFFVVIISFILFMYTKIHPAFIIIGAGILGAF